MIMTRIAVIRKEDCHPDKCGNYLCARLCPVNRTGTECIVKQDDKAFIHEDLCTGCGICPKRCPFGAITIINLPEELASPIHRFGPNGFALYSLPMPVEGKVAGIIGRNALGKSTAIKVLAGLIKPNLGTDKETGHDELISFFKGTQTQAFLEQVRDGKVAISFKPQQVDMIPKSYKGTVGALLAKVVEPVAKAETIAALSLGHLLEHDIATLSGGELQRVAIAAACIRPAQLYILDEPTSYLDIRQRILLSRFMEQLSQRASVILIEHDLIILDYLADQVQIMYGREGAYGVVSRTRPVRTGINVYLSGYLKEENIRFRDQPIKFSEHPPTATKAKQHLVSWEGIKAQRGDFLLDAPAGQLPKGFACGVLGENGTGKTTFVKILAGVDKQDSGTIDASIKVAYKPQYLTVEEDTLVLAVLPGIASKRALMTGLNLEPLLQKQLSWLSGGELQRVALARCLSQDAGLFLLDEPSAYLDIEQRLGLAKLIKELTSVEGKTVLVVDHDLLFLDAISDFMMVFSGEPGTRGVVGAPVPLEDAMNTFLRSLGITMRRDEDSKRPRINKLDSRKDREQKASGKLYYG